MLRRCLVLSGAFALAIAFGLGFALESRASSINALEHSSDRTPHDLRLGLARFDLGRDDDWRYASRDDDKSRDDHRSLGSRDDDDDGDKGKDEGKDKGDKGKSRDDDDGDKSWDEDDDGKPRHEDYDDEKPKPHHDDDEGEYSEPIPEPRAILAFTVGAPVVGWATRRARR